MMKCSSVVKAMRLPKNQQKLHYPILLHNAVSISLLKCVRAQLRGLVAEHLVGLWGAEEPQDATCVLSLEWGMLSDSVVLR